MDQHLRDLKPWKWRPPLTSILSLLIIFILTLLPVVVAGGFIWRGWNQTFIDETIPVIASIWRFTVSEAFASAVICLFFAPLLALGITTLPAKAQNAIWPLLLSPFCLPATVVGASFVLTLGRSGMVNGWLQSLGLVSEPISFLYHPWSILLPNVWMNLCLGAVVTLNAVDQIQPSQWRSAAILNFSGFKQARYILWPAVRDPLLTWFVLTFLLCLGSFGILLVMGSSPQSTTLELAIYQSIYYEGSMEKAGALALAQLTTGLIALFLAFWISPKFRTPMVSSERAISRPQIVTQPIIRNITRVLVSFILGLYSMPYIALILDVGREISTPTFAMLDFMSMIAPPILVSIRTALATCTLCMFACLTISPTSARTAMGRLPFWSFAFRSTYVLPIIIPGMITSFGIIAASTVIDSSLIRELGTYFLQCLSFLPVVTSLYLVGWRQNMLPFDNAQRIMGLGLWKTVTMIDFPSMKIWIAMVGALSFSLSMSETTISTMLADPVNAPLTVTIHRLMSAYHFGEASCIGLTLLFLNGIISGIIWRAQRSFHA